MERLPPHLEMHQLYRSERRRTLVAGVWFVVVLFAMAALILKDIPRAFDGRVADTEVQHGKSLMCLIHVNTLSGTVRVRRFDAEPCAVLGPGLHVTKRAWGLWIEGGSHKVAVLSEEECAIAGVVVALALMILAGCFRIRHELANDPKVGLVARSHRRASEDSAVYVNDGRPFP